MSDLSIQHDSTRKENYWCEQEGKTVVKCNGQDQCWDCALIQSQEEEELRSLMTKINYRNHTVADMQRADELTRRRLKDQIK